MIHFDFINEVLALFEGSAYTKGYIPCSGGTYYGGTEPDKGEPLGASGVTIATGVDLGQQTSTGLRAMGLSLETLAVLTPYIGLKKQYAVQRLKEKPLTITQEQVKEIDDAVHKTYIADAARKFGQERFEAAPKEAQAVAVSLCYQFGNPSRLASPGLGLAWDAIKAGNYKSAAQYLTDLRLWNKDHQFISRREQEAALLGAINAIGFAM